MHTAPSELSSSLNLPVTFLAQRMHAIWLKNFQQTHALGEKRYKPVPDKSLQGWSRAKFRTDEHNGVASGAPRQITHLMSVEGETKDVRHMHLFDCQLVEKEGVSFIVQNIAQPPKWINPSLMHQLNGSLAEEYLKAALPLTRDVDQSRAEEVRGTAAKRLHAIWVETNKDWAPKEQLVRYEDLPAHEQEKDLLLADVVLQTAWEARELLDPDAPDRGTSLDI